MAQGIWIPGDRRVLYKGSQGISPVSFTELLWQHSDADGKVAWHIAIEATKLHGMNYQFVESFRGANGAPIDTQQLLNWLGY